MINYESFQCPHLRLAIITPPLVAGGAERWVVTLCRHLVSCQVTTVITKGTNHELERELPRDVTLVDVDKIKGGERGAIHTAYSRGCDLILTWGAPELGFLRGEQRVPLLHVSHTSERQHQFSKDSIHANFLAAVSESAAEVFPDDLCSRTTVQVIHNGVDLERTRPRFGRRWQRRVWGLPESDQCKVLLYLGRFSREKNPLALVRAMEYLPREYHLAMVGWGPLTEQIIQESVKYAGSSPFEDVPSRIFFPKPQLKHVGDLLAASDVVVIPSHMEAFPLTLIEAWLARVPVVSTKYTSLREITEVYGKNVFEVDSDPDPTQLASAIKEALTSAFTANMVEAAFKIALVNLTASSMATRWEDFFHYCVNSWQESGIYGQTQFAKIPEKFKTERTEDAPPNSFTESLQRSEWGQESNKLPQPMWSEPFTESEADRSFKEHSDKLKREVFEGLKLPPELVHPSNHISPIQQTAEKQVGLTAVDALGTPQDYENEQQQGTEEDVDDALRNAFDNSIEEEEEYAEHLFPTAPTPDEGNPNE